MPEEDQEEQPKSTSFRPTSELVAGLDLSAFRSAEATSGQVEADGPIEPTRTVVHATANLVSGPDPFHTLALVSSDIDRTLDRHRRIVLCPPEMVDQVQEWVDRQRVPRMFEVRPSGDVPAGRVYVFYPGALGKSASDFGYDDPATGPSPLREEG